MNTTAQSGTATIDQLIINSPYEEPTEHWRYHRETRLFTRESERRKAGYVRASESSRTFDDPGIFVELPLVNQIRQRIKTWREADYPGTTGITKRLLQHWRDSEVRDPNRRFFFCQLEAIETLTWITESPASERVGIEVPSDGGPFPRLCSKMATGSGKTILMSMLIAWQVLNKVTYPQDKRFSTYTAARVEYAFRHKRINIEELCNEEGILHIDSRVLDQAEEEDEPVQLSLRTVEADEETPELINEADEPALQEKKLSKKEQAEALRRQVDTVGLKGQPGQKIQNVISVGMLSEGWDAKTVTHIMGLRAFTSQLLCEQVVGRGLRRTSYEVDEKTGLFQAEYVNIFGVPFTFLPHEGGGDAPPPPPPAPKTRIEALPERKAYEIVWPNVLRIDHEYRPTLSLDMNVAKPITLDAYETPTLAEMAPIIEGKPDVTRIAEISLRELGEKFRIQKIIFNAASRIYEQMKATWKGSTEHLLIQVIRMVEQYIESDKIRIEPALFNQDPMRRRILITLHISSIAEHLKQAIHFTNTQALLPIFDSERPIRATGDMLPWYTGKACEHTRHSHINLSVFDSRWEASEAFELDRSPYVAAWVKNDHLGFEITYSYRGIIRKYRPDYLIRLANQKMLILEIKGQDNQEQQTKREFLGEWVGAINSHGGFGQWSGDVSRNPTDIHEILSKQLGN